MAKRLVLGAAAAAFIALLVGCSARGFGNDNDCDYVILAGTTGVQPLDTGRRSATDLPLRMAVSVEFAAQPGGAGTVPEPSPLAAFQLTHYDVTYRNLTTGGTVPGIDVPRPLRLSVASSPALPPATLDLTSPILTIGQKQEAPLNDSAFYPNNGVTLEATVTFWGNAVGNPNAQCFASFKWIFSVTDSL